MKICLTEKLNRENIDVIKKLVSKLQELDINILDLIKRYIIENKNITKKIIDECTKMDFYIKKSYRSLIQHEGIIISLNIFLTNTI